MIVGAGIGGLAAGIALRRAGWTVRVFERSASPRELGFALSVAPNAVLALRELGVADRIIGDAAVARLIEIRGAGGRRLKRFDATATLGQVPAVFALREVVHGALLEALGAETLSLDSTTSGFDDGPDGVILRLANGRTERGDVLVGADGVASIVRRQLHPVEPPPRPSGYYGLRGVARATTDLLGGLSGVAYMVRGLEAATFNAGRDAVYWYMSLLAQDVGDPPDAPGRIARRLAARLDDGFERILRVTAPEDMRLDPLFMRDALARWGSGAVTLLGDAAHPMLPHTGQGAAQALEDAVALGLALTPRGDVAAALRKYEDVRSRRTTRIVRRGPRLASFTTNDSRVLATVRDLLLRVTPAGLMAKAFLFKEDADPHAALRSAAPQEVPQS